MSRELIVIPKAKYDALLKQDELTKTESIQDSDVQNTNKQNKNIPTVVFSKDETLVENKVNETGDDFKLKEDEQRDFKMDNPLNKNDKKIKSKNMKIGTRTQSGSGKSYVQMSPIQFLNDKKHTLKNKWLSFPI